jgi:type II secretory pathway component PulF
MMGTGVTPPEPSLFERLVVIPLRFWPTPKGMAQFYEQLASLLEAGLPIRHALDALQSQCSSWSLRGRIPEMIACIDTGGSAADAFARFPGMFDPIHVAMIRAGERAGRLDEVLRTLCTICLRRARVIRSAVLGLLYPLFILHMVFFIAPVVRRSMGAEESYLSLALPPFLGLYSALFLLVVVPRLLRQFATTAFVMDTLKSMVPVLGSASRKLAVSRAARAIVGLYDAGLTLPQALPAAADACGNELVARNVRRLEPLVKEGVPLSQAMRQVGGFPSALLNMLATGEESGQVSTMLANAATYYESEAETAAKAASIILPVVVYLGVAAYAAYFVISFYMKLFSRTGAMGQ